MLSEVLLRLPAKELCRLRLVCREWRALTSDLSFAASHSSRHQLIVGLLKPPGCEIHVMDLTGRIVKRTRIEKVSYGDLSTHPNILFMPQESTMNGCVLNLATGALMLLPAILGHITFGHSYMLGYVPSTGECKVLRTNKYLMKEGGTGDMYHVITLGRGDGQWRARACPPKGISWIFDDRVVIDGVAYFISNDDNNYTYASIIMFDLETEEWMQSTLQLPLENSIIFVGPAKNLPMHIDHQLTELSGCLVAINCNRHDYSIDLWFLEDMDKGLWTKRYSVHGSLTNWDGCQLRPLILLADGRIVLWRLRAKVLRVYDLTTSTWADWASLGDYSGIFMLNGSLLCWG